MFYELQNHNLYFSEQLILHDACMCYGWFGEAQTTVGWHAVRDLNLNFGEFEVQFISYYKYARE